MLVEFKGIGNNLNRPSARLAFLARLKAEPEVPRVSRHATESIHEASGISLAIVIEPNFWRTSVACIVKGIDKA